jgi:hypothetical protein
MYLDGSLIQEMNVFCDICEYSYLGGRRLPIIRRIFESNEIFSELYYTRISTNEINRIRVYIKERHFKIPSVGLFNSIEKEVRLSFILIKKNK